MKFKSIVPVLAATFAITGVSMAEAGERNKNKNKNRPEHSQQMKRAPAGYSLGAGVATAGRQGAEAGAIIGSGARTSDRCVGVNTATTVGAGAVHADRRSASGSVATGGTASGTGSVSASSGVDAWATRDTLGSDAAVAGGSTANADEATRTPPGC